MTTMEKSCAPANAKVVSFSPPVQKRQVLEAGFSCWLAKPKILRSKHQQNFQSRGNIVCSRAFFGDFGDLPSFSTGGGVKDFVQ